MSRGSAPPISKLVALNRRQELNIRSTQESARISSLLMNRIGKFAAGELYEAQVGEDGKWIRDEEGKPIKFKSEMTSNEIHATKIYLAKTIPDKVAYTDNEEDEFDNLSKEELIARITENIEKHPELASITSIQTAVDKSKTVKTIEKDEST